MGSNLSIQGKKMQSYVYCEYTFHFIDEKLDVRVLRRGFTLSGPKHLLLSIKMRIKMEMKKATEINRKPCFSACN